RDPSLRDPAEFRRPNSCLRLRRRSTKTLGLSSVTEVALQFCFFQATGGGDAPDLRPITSTIPRPHLPPITRTCEPTKLLIVDLSYAVMMDSGSALTLKISGQAPPESKQRL